MKAVKGKEWIEKCISECGEKGRLQWRTVYICLILAYYEKGEDAMNALLEYE